MESFAGPLPWIIFITIVVGLLALDLFVFHRKAHEVTPREATLASLWWIGLAMGFGAFLWLNSGGEVALTYFTGYLIEKALSVDNLFVFVMVFSYFAVPNVYQHRILFWGVLGVLVMRGILIIAGAALLERLEWLIYVFGAFLVITGVRMAFHRQEAVDLDRNLVVRLARRVLPVTSEYEGEKFLIRRTGRIMATPLLLVLIVIETTDLVFALDSIPAIFGVTTDTFIVFTSNVFAILGLRSLYFLLARVIHKFRFIKVGLAAVLVFVGLKMVAKNWVHIATPVSLLVIASTITASILISLIFPARLPDNCPHCETELETDSDICPGCGEIVVPAIADANGKSAAETLDPSL